MTKHRENLTFSLVLAVLAALLPAAAQAALARKNDPMIELRFSPQQTVAKAEVTIRGAMLDRPARLVLVDDRGDEDSAAIGTRTNDADEVFALEAVGEGAVMSFVDEVTRDSIASWGVDVDEDAPLTLSVRLLKFDVLEKNQVVGATYNAEVRFAYSLLSASGESRLSSTAMGDATRYGRKFSNANINEVLSDALLEVIANMLNDTALQEAWGK